MTTRIENLLLTVYALVVLAVAAWLIRDGGPVLGVVLIVALVAVVIVLHVKGRK